MRGALRAGSQGRWEARSPEVSVLPGSILGTQRSDNGSYVCKLNISGVEVVSDPILVQLEGELEQLWSCVLAEYQKLEARNGESFASLCLCRSPALHPSA